MSETIPAKLEAMDDRFHTCQGDSTVERLYAGCRWAEGHVYVPSGRYLVWSDIPNDRLLPGTRQRAWSASSGTLPATQTGARSTHRAG